MARLPKVKLRGPVAFPSSVTGGTGIDVAKANGAFTIAFDVSELIVSNVPSDKTTTTYAISFGGVTTDNPKGTYSLTPFSGFQGVSADLTSLAELDTTGIVSRIGDADYVTRTITAGTGIGVTNGGGVAGNPTIAISDAELLALAGVTSAADRLFYFTGSGTGALATLTSFGRSLVDDADAATARATLGAVIGTNVQAWDGDLDALAALSGTSTIYYRSGSAAWSAVTIGGLLSFSAGTLNIGDAELSALAGLISAADKLPYFTGAGTAALADFSAFARTLVDDADAATARATLGLGNVDNTSDANKPVSTAQAAADATKVTGPSSVTDDLPAIFDGTTGKLVKSKTYAAFKTLLALVKGDVGLGSVDNTADSAKIVASAAILTTARAIDGQNFDGSAAITVIAPGTHAATSKATPVDADELPLVDSVASNVLKKLTWANLKATLKTYLDTLYQTILTAGQLPGTATNDNATAGNVGEVRECKALNTGAGATATITIASPGVVTWTAHGLGTDGLSPINFTTTGALPTGLAVGTIYWTVPGTVTTNTFQLATSIANAIAGTAINTSGSQSGTHTVFSRVALTTGTTANFCALSLTAGDWDVTGTLGCVFGGTTNVTYISGGWATSIATVDQTPGRASITSYGVGTVLGNTVNQQIPFPRSRLSISSTTTVYAFVNMGFTVASAEVFGSLTARRMR